MKKVIVLIVLVLCMVGTVRAELYAIKPTANQDGTVYGWNWQTETYMYAEQGAIGWYGYYNAQQMDVVAIFTLPVGLTSADIVNAVLIMPQMDYVWNGSDAGIGQPQGTQINLHHIDATSDVIVRVSDIDADRDLGMIGAFHEATTELPVFNQYKTVSFNVTAQVGADMDEERLSFAVKTNTIVPVGGTSSYFVYPTVENGWWANQDATLYIATPEPATIALLLIGGLSMLRRKKA